MYYYYWSEEGYSNGVVFMFKTKEEAEKHSKENYKDADIDIEEYKEGEIIDIYTGE
jgi:hypothetical protein